MVIILRGVFQFVVGEAGDRSGKFNGYNARFRRPTRPLRSSYMRHG